MAKAGRICRHSLASSWRSRDGDVLREGIRVPSQALMKTEVAGLIGEDRHERSADRTGTVTAIGRGPGTRGAA
jgi:hypothetical protein